MDSITLGKALFMRKWVCPDCGNTILTDPENIREETYEAVWNHGERSSETLYHIACPECGTEKIVSSITDGWPVYLSSDGNIVF